VLLQAEVPGSARDSLDTAVLCKIMKVVSNRVTLHTRQVQLWLCATEFGGCRCADR
jgi:hypothetical protein